MLNPNKIIKDIVFDARDQRFKILTNVWSHKHNDLFTGIDSYLLEVELTEAVNKVIKSNSSIPRIDADQEITLELTEQQFSDNIKDEVDGMRAFPLRSKINTKGETSYILTLSKEKYFHIRNLL